MKRGLLCRFHIYAKFISNKCDKLRVGGFALAAVDGIAEIGIEHVNVAAYKFIGLFIALIFSRLLDYLYYITKCRKMQSARDSFPKGKRGAGY